MSFGYYINVPIGSSATLLVEGKEDRIIILKKDNLFVFDSSLLHVVNPSPVKGRMICRRIAYLSRFGN